MEERRKASEETERMKNLQVNEINFPSLAPSEWTTVVPKKKWERSSFASLAETWSAKEEQDRKQREEEEAVARRELMELEAIRRRRRNLSYNFGSAHSRTEDTYYEEYDDNNHNDTPKVEDWTTVAKKPRKERSQFDYSHERPPTPVEHSDVWDDRAYEDTAWGNH
jgi:hypothetical protein